MTDHFQKRKNKSLSHKYTESGATIRVSFAEKIFLDHEEINALKIIMDSNRLDYHVKETA